RSGLDVALKIVPREGKSGHRAEREARAAAALRHGRCQRILSLARDPSHVYIAYEYVPGRTLREALRAGAIDDRAALEVAPPTSPGTSSTSWRARCSTILTAARPRSGWRTSCGTSRSGTASAAVSKATVPNRRRPRARRRLRSANACCPVR